MQNLFQVNQKARFLKILSAPFSTVTVMELFNCLENWNHQSIVNSPIKENFESVTNPANFYEFKFNNRSTRKRCEVCSKLTIKTQE